MVSDRGNYRSSIRGRTNVPIYNILNKIKDNVYVSTRDKHRYSGVSLMARGRRTVSRMEKFVEQSITNVPAASSVIFPYQLDGGEVEAQVKRIMLSLAQSGGTSSDFQFK